MSRGYGTSFMGNGPPWLSWRTGWAFLMLRLIHLLGPSSLNPEHRPRPRLAQTQKQSMQLRATRALGGLRQWLRATLVELPRQMRWSFLPPLMVYFAAGISGLSAIVGTFFVKDYLQLSASFLAGLTFWAGLPWALKMPIGHIVDLIWRRKAALVFLGASLIAASIVIMYGLIAHTGAMRAVMSAESWFVLSTLLAPIGYVIQDAVADAMTVEAVPKVDAA